MRKMLFWTAIGLVMGTLAPASAALADVKAGVDAWSRGEYRKAVEQWRPLAIAGDADAQFNLGQAYKLGRGVPIDLAMAESWYRKAAMQGHAEAETNYGLILFQNDKRADALPWLEKSAARAEPRAQLVLGTMLYNGDGVARDWPRAYALMTRSSAAGLPQASSVLAQMDQYIPAEQRQKGILLARQYEAAANRAVAPSATPPVARTAIRPAEIPPSTVEQPKGTRPAAVTPPRAVPPAAPGASRSVSTRIAGRGWRVQFGAFRDEGNAQGLWQRLKAKAGALGELQPYLVKSRALTRLQAGPLASRGAADKICAAVRAASAGTPCVPIAP